MQILPVGIKSHEERKADLQSILAGSQTPFHSKFMCLLYTKGLKRLLLTCVAGSCCVVIHCLLVVAPTTILLENAMAGKVVCFLSKFIFPPGC